jgi:hypothetical protein
MEGPCNSWKHLFHSQMLSNAKEKTFQWTLRASEMKFGQLHHKKHIHISKKKKYNIKE